MLKTAPILITLLSACTPPQDDTQTSTEVPTSASVERVGSLSEIEGFWFVEKFENFEPNDGERKTWRSAFVEVKDDYLGYNIGCNGSGNPARIRRGILKDTGSGERIQTLVGCGPEREARDERFFGFFGRNPTVHRDGDGAVRMQAGDTILLLLDARRYLERYGAPVADIAGRWIPQFAEAYRGAGSSASYVGDDPGVLTLSQTRLSWSRCPQADVKGRYTIGHRFVKDSGPDECEDVIEPSTPGGQTVVRVMQGDPAFVKISRDRVMMFTDGEAITLQSEDSVLNPRPLPPPDYDGPRPPPPPPPPPKSRN